jgi:hypothetical protein
LAGRGTLSKNELRQALKLGLAQLKEQSADVSEHRRQVQKTMIAVGLSLPTPDALPNIVPLTPERRRELAERFGTGEPLSELIIKEREGR